MNSKTPPRSWPRHETVLSIEDVEILTGRKWKRQQREALVLMRIPFAVTVAGDPIVPRSSIEGSKAQAGRDVKALQEQMDFALRMLDASRRPTAIDTNKVKR